MTSPFARKDAPSRLPDAGKHRFYKADAVVLDATPIGDADRIVTAFTAQYGKLRLTVRGARRVTSKIAGHLDKLNHARIDVTSGRTFDVITGAESVETFPRLKAEIERVAEACRVMELALRLLPEAAPHPGAFRILLDALRSLEAGRNPATVARCAELVLLADSGYLPELRRCLGCGREIERSRHRFAPALGGVVCGACPAGAGPALDLSVEALKALRYFAEQPLPQAAALRVGPEAQREIEAALGAMARHVLERELHAAGLVEHLRRLRPHNG